MKHVPYVVYNPATGEIARTGHCPENQVAIQAGRGLSVMQGEARDDTHRVEVKNGVKKLVCMVEPVEDKFIKKGINPALAQRFAHRIKDKQEAAKIAARPKSAAVSHEKLLAALKKRGIDIPLTEITG